LFSFFAQASLVGPVFLPVSQFFLDGSLDCVKEVFGGLEPPWERLQQRFRKSFHALFIDDCFNANVSYLCGLGQASVLTCSESSLVFTTDGYVGTLGISVVVANDLSCGLQNEAIDAMKCLKTG
jgi:hypothetical protein